MKQLVPLFSLLLSNSALALNPVQGFYIGLLGQVSHGPTGSTVHFREDNSLFTGKVGYSIVSGGAGTFIGYKYKNARVDGELLYNRISTGPLTVGTCVLQSPSILTPTGLCPQEQYDHFQAKSLGYSGSSSVVYGLINGYWDFFGSSSEYTMAPYVGIGFGQAKIKNSSNFVNTVTLASHGNSVNFSSYAMQGTLGLSYFMDDFSWVSLDLRYLTTKKTPNFENESYTLGLFTFSVSFAFDKGGINS